MVVTSKWNGKPRLSKTWLAMFNKMLGEVMVSYGESGVQRYLYKNQVGLKNNDTSLIFLE